MLRLIIGSADSQVSQNLVSDMTQNATEHLDEKFIIIVPEQFTLQTQKRVVSMHPQHACMNIDVVSFDRLAHVVLAKLGKDITDVLDDVGKALILRSVLENCAQDLNVYRSKIRMPGFVEELKSLITEFLQYGIDDNSLYLMEQDAQARGSLLVSKLADIRLIYRKFNEAIADTYTTSEEVLDVFARCLPESDFMTGCHIYLDGFTGFTPIQYRLLEQMMSCAASVSCSITMPYSAVNAECTEYDIFALTNATYFKLRQLAADHNISCQDVECPDVKQASDMTVRCISCAGLQEEVDFAAGEILHLVRDEGRRFRDIAVLTADMESYYYPVRNTFAEAGISAFIDYKSDFTDNLLVRFIKAALEIACRGMMYDQMFNFIKTGLTGLSGDEVSQLENYCLEFNIKGKNRWESPFSANRELNGGGQAWNLDILNEMRLKVSKPVNLFFGTMGNGGSKPRKVALFCKGITRLLEDFGIKDKITAISKRFMNEGNLALGKQYEQMYEKITDLLEKVRLLMGERTVAVREFANILESGMDEIKITTIPPSMDALVVGDLTRTRLDTVSHLFVLGVNDGKIPSAGSGSALFTQREREFLRKDFEIAPTVLENLYTQRYYLYLAFNRPWNGLYLTYAGVTPSGEQLSPSCILEDIDELVPGCGEPVRETFCKKNENLWKRSAVMELASEIREMTSDGDKTPGAVFRYFAAVKPDTIRQLVRGAAFTNRQSSLDPQVALDLYGDVLKGSVSRYETFYMCPYRHFLNYGLRLEKRREYQVQVTDLGTIYHDTLEKYSKRLKDEGLSFRDINDEDSHRITGECVTEAIEGIGNDILSSSARNEFLKKRIGEISERTTDVLREHVKAGLFEPDKFEYPFNEQISDSVVFKGKIDRIDIYDAGDIFVKIIDYKSGSKKFSVNDIYSGIQLQLVAYMNSAVKSAQEEYPGRNVRPGGVYYYLVNDKYVKPDETDNKNRMSGLTLADDNLIHAIDKNVGSEGNMSSTIIPVTYTKNGMNSRSSVASAAEFDNLINFVNRRIVDAGERIKRGEIDLAPFKENDEHTGCSFCDYRDICRFEAGNYGTDWRECSAGKEDMEEEVYGRHHLD